MQPFVTLPKSGITLRPEKVSYVLRKGLNQYVLVMADSNLAPNIPGEDLDALLEHVGGSLKLVAKEPEKALAVA